MIPSLRVPGLFFVSLSLAATLLSCEPKEPPGPPVVPPPEDLSMWTLPELVQAEPAPLLPTVAKPVRVPAGPAERVVDYAPGMVVEVPVAVGAPFDIVLEAGEQVRLIVDGDRAPLPEGAEKQQRRWQVVEGKEGSGAHQREHLLVTVTEAGLTNGLTITTTRRSYYVMCKSVTRSPLRVLRWDYPEDVWPVPPEPAPPRPPGLLPYPDELIRYHVGYTIEANGRPPDWMPRQVVDDGKKLYLLSPEVTLFGTVPLVRLIGPNGPQLLNARQYLNVVIIDQLPPRLELRAGLGEGAEVVTITRGKLRTMACPGDGECPMFPRAAHELARRQP